MFILEHGSRVKKALKNLSIFNPKNGFQAFGNISVADPGCLSRIPDPTFSIPDPGSELSPSRIPDPGSSSKNLSILTPKKAKKMVSKL
jgi:hypothetical protein